MSITRRTFLGGTSLAAVTLAGCDKTPPRQLETNAEELAQLEALLTRKNIDYRKPEASLGKRLNAMIDNIYQNAPRAIDDLNILPPKPKLLIQNIEPTKEAIYFQNLRTRQGNASIILISEGAVKNTTPDEMEVSLAHEIAHHIMQANPHIAERYRIPNNSEALEDLNKKNIGPWGDKAEFYRQELCADDIAVRITQKPEALASVISKMSNQFQTEDKVPSPEVRAQAARLSAESAERWKKFRELTGITR